MVWIYGSDERMIIVLDVIIDDIKKTLDDFHAITGMPISLYDEDMTPIYHASKSEPLCAQLRKYPQTKKLCKMSDYEGEHICRETKHAYVYTCHAGLVEANIPICENNVIIGYLLTGQIACSDNIDRIKNTLHKYSLEYGADINDFLNALEEMDTRDRKYIDAAVNMIEMAASYLCLSRTIKKKSYILSAQLKEYIDNHLSEDLSIQNLCDKMFMSKTKLYKLSMKTFNMGCSEYITLKRIEKAKTLLESSDKNIYTIAEEVGFNDANYFSRIFKKIVGITPGEYKKNS